MEKAVKRRQVSKMASVVKNRLFGFRIVGLKLKLRERVRQKPRQNQDRANIAEDAKAPNNCPNNADEN